MWPVIWRIPIGRDGIPIHSFGTFLVLGFLVAAFYARRRAWRDLGVDRERTFNICFGLLFLALAGARVLYVLIHHAEMGRPMAFLEVWKGGFAFYGGLFACLAWLAWYLPRHPDLGGWAFADRLALGAGLAIFVGRWASFLSGENYGKQAPDLAWAVTFTHAESQARPLNVALHPTQLYHSLHGLLLFALLWLFLRRQPWSGKATGLFLALYALGRAVIEIWRGDDAARGMVIDGLVSVPQVLSIPVFFAGVAIFLVRRAPYDAAARAA